MNPVYIRIEKRGLASDFAAVMKELQIRYKSIVFVGWIGTLKVLELDGERYKVTCSPNGVIHLRPTSAKVFVPSNKKADYEKYRAIGQKEEKNEQEP